MYILYVYMYIPVHIFTKKKKTKQKNKTKQKKKKKTKKKNCPFSLSCVHKKMRDHLNLRFPCSLPRGLISRQKRGVGVGGGGGGGGRQCLAKVVRNLSRVISYGLAICIWIFFISLLFLRATLHPLGSYSALVH